jgi:hypothetical protein
MSRATRSAISAAAFSVRLGRGTTPVQTSAPPASTTSPVPASRNAVSCSNASRVEGAKGGGHRPIVPAPRGGNNRRLPQRGTGRVTNQLEQLSHGTAQPTAQALQRRDGGVLRCTHRAPKATGLLVLGVFLENGEQPCCNFLRTLLRRACLSFDTLQVNALMPKHARSRVRLYWRFLV